ncbi:MAG TPA: C40 family peptidase [Bacteroidales bacterium]|jgi:cell wall-associated NlpC family hydrolase|nr:C40 family peptidase [Bacteroidales bacterium]
MRTKILSILILLFQLPVLAFSQDNTVLEIISASNHNSDLINYYKAVPKDTMRLRIIEKAREYIGVDYKWGESGANGFDCSGYVKYIYDQFGYKLPHSSYEQYNASRRLIESKAKPGDLVFFVTRGNRISHVGIYLGNKSFIHAPSTGKQVRIESLDTGFFRKTLAGFGTLL